MTDRSLRSAQPAGSTHESRASRPGLYGVGRENHDPHALWLISIKFRTSGGTPDPIARGDQTSPDGRESHRDGRGRPRHLLTSPRPRARCLEDPAKLKFKIQKTEENRPVGFIELSIRIFLDYKPLLVSEIP